MADKKYYEINFDNGYAGCSDSRYICVSEDIDVETEFAGELNIMLEEYADNYSHCCFGWEGEYSDEEYDEYLENCCISIIPTTLEELEDNGIDESDIEDWG